MAQETEPPHCFHVTLFTKDKRMIEGAIEVMEVARIINEVREAEYRGEEPRFAFQFEKKPEQTYFCTTMVHRLEPEMFTWVTNDPLGN